MKLPNWLHRKPRILTIDEWAENYTHGDYPTLADDPYLDNLAEAFAVKGQYEAELSKPGHVPGEYATSLKERWAEANEMLFLAPPESVEGAHARGYWEGRAEANPEYSVEIVPDEYGAIEEVLLHDATRCLVHLERLDTDHWWLTLSPTGGWDDETTLDIFRVKKCIEVTEQ